LKLRLDLGPDSKDVTLTENPLIWDSTDPSLLLAAKPLPDTIDISDQMRTEAEIAAIVDSQTHLTGRTKGFKTTFTVDGSTSVAPESKGGREALVRTITSQLTEDLSPEPQILRVSLVSKNSGSLTRDVVCIQRKPVTADIVMALGHPWIVVHNPGRRPFKGHSAWEGQAPAPIGDFTSVGGVDEIHAVGTGAQSPEEKGLYVWLDTRNGNGSPRFLNLVTALDRFSYDPSGLLNETRFALTQDGDPKVPVSMACKAVTVEEGPLKGAQSLRIDYQFQQGWKFLELHARGDSAKPIDNDPVSLNMFVTGNTSGNYLRMRFVDATGQAFQPDFGKIDWEGWKFVSFKLDGKDTGHWGGAGDGVVHYPIRLETLVLIDSAGKSNKAESISVTGITLIARKKA
jgi:hypothetical protein